MKTVISSDRSGHEIEEHLFRRLAHAPEIVVEGDDEGDDIAVLDRLCARFRRGRIETGSSGLLPSPWRLDGRQQTPWREGSIVTAWVQDPWTTV